MSVKDAYHQVHNHQFLYDSFLNVYMFIYSQDSQEFFDAMNLGVDAENDSDLTILKALIQTKTQGSNPIKLYDHPEILRAIKDEFSALSEIEDDKKLYNLMKKADAEEFNMDACSTEIRETVVGIQSYIDRRLKELEGN